MTIRNPVEWTADSLGAVRRATGSAARTVHHADEHPNGLSGSIRRIGAAEIGRALARGWADFSACRSDVFFLSLIYPVIGLVLWRVALHNDLMPLLFPLAAGFAIIGPFAAVGLYEMSRRRETGAAISWPDAFGVLASPSFGAIIAMGLILFGLFAAWIGAAHIVYGLTLGPAAPASFAAFAADVFGTEAGWTMIVVGLAVGFLFAALALAISVVSFPLLLDRKVGVDTAIWTSIRAVVANPGPMAAWGVIVAAALVAGSIPLFVGLIVVMPVLGHATWHLYREVIAESPRLPPTAG